LICGFGRLPSSDQNISEIDPCLNIAGLKVDGAQQLSVGGHDRSLLDENLGELIVGIGEVVVDLESVLELNHRFFKLALISVAFAAFEVSLLLLVGIAMTTRG
jgi:hypothetical protein